jgi:hypothetical protein
MRLRQLRGRFPVGCLSLHWCVVDAVVIGAVVVDLVSFLARSIFHFCPTFPFLSIADVLLILKYYNVFEYPDHFISSRFIGLACPQTAKKPAARPTRLTSLPSLRMSPSKALSLSTSPRYVNVPLPVSVSLSLSVRDHPPFYFSSISFLTGRFWPGRNAQVLQRLRFLVFTRQPRARRYYMHSHWCSS